MFRCSTPLQCSLVHIHICGCIVFIHMYLLSPSAHGTTQHNQHMWTCAEHHRARVLQQPRGKWALHYSDLGTYSALQECSTTPKWRGIIVQSADMHVLAFYASSVQLMCSTPHQCNWCVLCLISAAICMFRHSTPHQCSHMYIIFTKAA